MVRTLNRNNGHNTSSTTITQQPTNPHEVESQDVEQESKEPTSWIRKTAVQIRNLPLSPEILDGEVHYVTSKGNPIILDQRYALFRVGMLLSELGFSLEDVGTEDLATFTEDALKYYIEEYPKETAVIEAEKLEGQRDAVLAKAIPQFKKMSALLGFTDRLSWTDDQWIEFISKQA